MFTTFGTRKPVTRSLLHVADFYLPRLQQKHIFTLTDIDDGVNPLCRLVLRCLWLDLKFRKLQLYIQTILDSCDPGQYTTPEFATKSV